MAEMKSLTLNDKTYDSFVDPVARALAEASAVIKTASGESISVSDASEGKPYRFSLYGKTTQNGTPTPDSPAGLVSTGDGGSITVTATGKNESKRIVFATPNGLPGIPVTTGGNYTDTNGRQWVCDEMNFVRGVYIQRIRIRTLDGTETIGVEDEYYGTRRYSITFTDAIKALSTVSGLCSHFKYNYEPIGSNKTDNAICVWTTGNAYCRYDGATTVSELANFLASQKAAGTPVEIAYILETPIEIPLSDEVVSAFESLVTYRDQTVITNDSNAGMSLEYAIDIRKYIDAQISGAILEATVE